MSYTTCFTTVKRAPSTQWIRGRVDPRHNLDVLEISCPCQKLDPHFIGNPLCSSVTTMIELSLDLTTGKVRPIPSKKTNYAVTQNTAAVVSHLVKRVVWHLSPREGNCYTLVWKRTVYTTTLMDTNYSNKNHQLCQLFNLVQIKNIVKQSPSPRTITTRYMKPFLCAI